VTGTPIDYDTSKSIAGPTADLQVRSGRLAPEQDVPSVYAAYWQARSGFFKPTPKHGDASIDQFSNGPP
jgi:hypothetical protein